MAVPRQMTKHTLEAPKGWPNPHAVDFAAAFNTTDLAALTDTSGSTNAAYAPAGRCVHLHTDGTFKLGVTLAQMPLFLFNNSDDPDVSNPGGDPATDAGVWLAVAPRGNMLALVAKGAYELATTEFDSTNNYAPNDYLYSKTGTDLATAGKLTNDANDSTVGDPYPDETVVGIVSRGRTSSSPANSHGRPELFFWPVFLPGHSH